MRKIAAFAVSVGLMVVTGLLAQTPARTGKGASTKAPPIIDNARVRVWLNAQPGFRPQGDAVNVLVSPGRATATFVPVGGGSDGPLVTSAGMITGNPAPATSSAAQTALYIELKDLKVAPLANKSGYPNAFPRPGVKQLLDNAKVTVWEYRWTPGQPTPMHFHDKDVVVLYLEDGALTSTLPSGEKTTNEYKPGFVKFNNRDRIHTEVLSKGTQRAVMVELK